MRIRPRTEKSSTSGQVPLPAPRRGVPIVLLLALCLVFVAIAWIWYRYEGREVIRPRLRQAFPATTHQANDLPTLRLEIAEQAYRTLGAERDSALQRGRLPEDTLAQSAEIWLDGSPVSVQVALAGLKPDDWQDEKWSLDVQAQNGQTVLDMQSLTLRSPALCGYLDGWLYAESLRQAGILAPRYTFANLVVNGEAWGVYALQEGLSETFLTAQERQSGPVLRLRNNAFTTSMAGRFDLPVLAQVEEPNLTDGNDTIDHTARAQALLSAFQTQSLPLSEVLNAAQVGRYLAHVDLWGAEQGDEWQEALYYYDPRTDKLEPIALAHPVLRKDGEFLNGLTWYDALPIVEAYAQEALRISQPDYIETLLDKSERTFQQYRAALSQEFFPTLLEPPWPALQERQEMLSNALYPSWTVRAIEGDPEGPTVEIRVANLLRYPVALDQVRMGDQALEIQSTWVLEEDQPLIYPEAAPGIVLRAATERTPRYIRLRFPATALPAGDGKLELVTHLVGLEQAIIANLLPSPLTQLPKTSHLSHPSPQEALAQHPFLSPSKEPGFLDLAPGTWHVEGNLVLPDGLGLRASGPTTLTFERDALLLASGPLCLHGAEDGGIRLLPRETEWGGIVILNAGRFAEPSHLRHVEISSTTLGVTFYQSPVVLDRCRVSGSTAQYALHVVQSDFCLSDCEFAHASRHALGATLAAGQVRRCTFHNVIGYGIGLVESRATIVDTNLQRIYDRALSVDRNSQVEVHGMRARDVGIAVASANASSAVLDDARFAQTWVAGLVTYAPDRASTASIHASQVVFEDESRKTLALGAGEVRLDGLEVLDNAQNGERLSQRQALAGKIKTVDYGLGPAIRLLGYDLLTPSVSPGENLQFILYWQALSHIRDDYTVFVHVLGPDGQAVTQWDAKPRDNTYSTTAWAVGEAIDDLRNVPIPQDIPRGQYQIALGMYLAPTGERLAVRGPDGESVAHDTIVLDPLLEVN